MKDNKKALYRAREKRVLDAIALRKPDRVPVTASFYFLPARLYGCSFQEMMYDLDKMFDVNLRITQEFEPDLAQSPFGTILPGSLLDVIDYKQMQWPGGQLGPDVPFQFVEGEHMKAEEYNHFLSDPMDFVIRKYWPQIYGSLQGFANFPQFRNAMSYTSTGIFSIFSSPEAQSMLDTLKKAGRESKRYGAYAQRFEKKLKQEGFFSQTGGMCQAPFDMLGDFFRGTKGIMLDMFRRPDMVLKACEKLLPMEIERGVSSARRSGGKFVFMPLHKGLDGFMSPEQFDKFYWPTLREVIIALINEGLVPYVFWEGRCTSRLEAIKDIPAGKAIYRFEATDMMKAKDILGDRVCIRGNVPISLLATGSPEDVRSCCKNLIDYVGRDGGFMMDAAAHVTEAKPENLRVMFDFTKEYGAY
ncbi:MAG: uroporphyrinogen decarboxylase family protein [Acidobacteriota bacterium]